MDRIICFLLISVMMFSLVSCSIGEPEELIPEYNSEDTQRLDGYDFTLYHSTVNEHVLSIVSEENLFGYPYSSVYGDKVLDRIADIEEETGANITFKHSNRDSNYINTQIFADFYIAEAFYCASQSLTQPLIKAGIFTPLNYFPAIDLANKEKYGDASILEIHSLNGDVYAVCPMSWMMKEPRTISALVFNTVLTNRFALPDPREYAESGAWNWDTFENVLATHTIDDGERKYAALACRFMDFIKLAFYGNGADYIEWNEDSKQYDYTINSPQALEAFDWCKKIVTTMPDALYWGTEDKDWMDNATVFANGDALITLTAPGIIYSSLIYDMGNFAVVPFPTGPKGEYGKWPSVAESSEAFAVFTTANYPEQAAIVIDMICEPMEDFTTREEKIDYLYRNALYDKRDAEIMLDLHKNTRYSYWTEITIDSFWRGMVSSFSSKTPTQIIESHEATITELIDEYIIPNQVLYEIYG